MSPRQNTSAALRGEERQLTRPVLLGGRTGLPSRARLAWLVRVWLPVAVCLAVISRESTNSFSAEYTSGPLRHLFQWIFGPVAPERWEVVHHYMRKTGATRVAAHLARAAAPAWHLVLAQSGVAHGTVVHHDHSGHRRASPDLHSKPHRAYQRCVA